MKKWLLLLIGLTLAQVACADRSGARAKAGEWDDWRAFNAAFISEDGRVIDWTQDGRTVSEGQAYAMFFALVANDPASFERVLRWTERHLARGSLAANLPSWLWGRAESGEQKVLDPNPATDADLWIAYNLIEAARLWRKPAYEAKARKLLKQVREQAVWQLADGATLLKPGPQGFDFTERQRLNPSYLVPLQMLRFAALEPEGPWAALLRQYPDAMATLSPTARIPDWSQYREQRHELDTETGGVGSYDAIRVYLWAGFGPASDPSVQQLRAHLKAFSTMIAEAKRVPEKWAARSSWIEGDAPVGFDAALLPFFAAIDDGAQLKRARERVAASREQNLYGNPARYYDQVLVLFGKGYDDGWFRFDPDGRLVPRWHR